MQKAVLLHTTHYSNTLKGSRNLRKFVVTGPQEHKFIVKTVYYVIRYNNNKNNNNNFPKAVTARVSKRVEHPYLKNSLKCPALGLHVWKLQEKGRRQESGAFK